MNKFRKTLLASGLLVASAALAQSVQRSLSLVVNGQVVTGKAIVVKGETFVPLSALKLLGVRASTAGTTLTLAAGSAASAGSSTVGGANQRSATEGCQGETLFNGLWRARVVSVEPIVRSETGGTPGWGVTLEFRNGTQKDISPKISFDAFGKGIYLIGPDGQSAGDISGDGFYSTFDKRVPPGGLVRGVARFWAGNDQTSWPAFQARKPAKLILSVLSTVLATNELLAYNTPNPTFRIDLTCQK